jgi:hypothetical protein
MVLAVHVKAGRYLQSDRQIKLTASHMVSISGSSAHWFSDKSRSSGIRTHIVPTATLVTLKLRITHRLSFAQSDKVCAPHCVTQTSLMLSHWHAEFATH